MRKRLLMLGGSLALLLGGGAPAWAQEAVSTAPPPAPPETAEQRIARLEALVQQLSEQVQDLKVSGAANVQALREDVEAQPKVSLANARPTFTTADGQFSAALRGVVHLDTADYRQDAAGPLATDFRRGSLGDATEAARARDLNSGTNFRRARIGVEAKAFGAFNYALIYEFGGSGSEDGGRVQDLWVEYAGLKPFRFRAGAFSPGTNLEDAVGTNGSLFLERAAPMDLVRNIAGGDGRVGVGLYANGDRWFASGFLTGSNTGNLNTASAFDEQKAFVGRAAYSVLKGEDYRVVLGVNTSQVITPPDAGPDAAGARYALRLRERPELRVDGTRLVDTGNIDADGLSAYGLEFGAIKKNFYVQAEYVKLEIDRRLSTLSDPEFDGWYVQGGWVLTGEPRRYNAATGGFDGPAVNKPFDRAKGQWGAWELGLRYSVLDLDYREGAARLAAPADGVRGGEQRIWTAAINWYLNPVVRLMLQVQDIDVDRLSPGGTAFGAAPLTPAAGLQVGQSLQSVAVRTQIAF